MRALRLLVRGTTTWEAVAVALLAAVATAALLVPSRTLERSGMDSVAQVLAEAPPFVSGVSLTVPTRDAGSVEELEASLRVAADEDLGEVAPFLGPPTFLAETLRFAVTGVEGVPPSFPTVVTLRVQPEAEAAATTVESAPPGPASVDDIPVVEAALSEATAEWLGWQPGDLIELVRRGDDPSAMYLFSSTEPLLLYVSEIVSLPEEAPFWFGDDAPVGPLVVDTSVGANVFITALVDAADLELTSQVAQTAGLAAQWRFPLADAEITVEAAERLEVAATRLDTATRDIPNVRGDPGVRTGLPLLLAAETARRRAAEVVVAGVAAAVLALVVVEAFVLGQAALTRRLGRLALTRGRGAGVGEVLGADAMGVVVPAGLGAAAAALLLGITWPTTGSWWAEALPAAAAVTAGLLSAAVAAVTKPLAVLLGKAPDRRRQARVAGAAAVVVVAALAVASGRSGGSLGAVAPVLLGLVAAGILGRGVRLPLRAAAGMDRVAVVGVWSAVRRPEPLRVVAPAAVALCVAGMAATISTAVATAVDTAAWQEVAAPVMVRLPGGTDPAVLAPFSPAGVARLDLRLQTSEGATSPVIVDLIDPAAMEAILAGTPSDPRLPDALFGQPVDGPIPIVLSSGFGREPLEVGARLTTFIAPDDVELVVAAVRDDFPGIPAGALFAVASRADYEHVVGQAPVPTRFLLADTGPELEAAVSAAGGSVIVRQRVAQELAKRPLTRGVSSGLALGMGTALAMGAAGVVAALVVEAPDLMRRSATLAAVGADRRQRLAVAVMEVLPPLAAGVVAGVAALAAALRWLGPVLDLGPFAGTAAAVSVQPAVLGWWTLLGLAIMTPVGVIFGMFVRRARPAPAMRAEAA